jgi:hypothetical protein
MKRFSVISVVLMVCLLGGFFQIQPSAQAAPALRVQVYQHGDFALIGNTFGYDCAAGTPAPVVGTLGYCGNNTTDSAADIFWRADDPYVGQAAANNIITNTQASSTAVLNLPEGAQVTHAYLYWSATQATSGAVDSSAMLARVGTGAFSQTVLAAESISAMNNSYRSVADVTALVQEHGTGAYRVSDVDITNWVGIENSNLFAGWWMVVFYHLSSAPYRQLALYDGFDPVRNGLQQSFTLSGFSVPDSGGLSKLGVVAMEGDNTIEGDSMTVNGTLLSNALNPVDNFFNSTRSTLGLATSVAGDLPQLTGGMQSTAGIDLDIVDITPHLPPGQTSASITASSVGDVYYLSSLVTSIVTDFQGTYIFLPCISK